MWALRTWQQTNDLDDASKRSKRKKVKMLWIRKMVQGNTGQDANTLFLTNFALGTFEEYSSAAKQVRNKVIVSYSVFHFTTCTCMSNVYKYVGFKYRPRQEVRFSRVVQKKKTNFSEMWMQKRIEKWNAVMNLVNRYTIFDLIRTRGGTRRTTCPRTQCILVYVIPYLRFVVSSNASLLTK